MEINGIGFGSHWILEIAPHASQGIFRELPAVAVADTVQLP